MNQKLTKLEKRWILYDVGNSAFVLLTSTIIPIYYKNIASASGISDSDSTAFFGYATSLVTILVAVLGPVLGTLADTKGFKKPVFTFFMMMGVLGCAGLALPATWVAFLAVYVLAKTGLNASLVFYDAMLPDVTTDERMDVVSAPGICLGLYRKLYSLYRQPCVRALLGYDWNFRRNSHGGCFSAECGLVVSCDAAAAEKL